MDGTIRSLANDAELSTMRLLNVSTLEFLHVNDPSNEKYAILSHTWVDDQEVTLQDWLRWRHRRRGWEDIDRRSGLAKILDACEKTKAYKLNLLWVDTNCIDKLSSAELSEAINSMFKWYSLSTICLTYLADVESYGVDDLIKTSRWFTRGWTLQELLAPRRIDFFSDDWTRIGSKTSLSLTIQEATGVDEKYLNGSEDFRLASVAARMSWAATRQTSRPEDMAYSLLGIFDINMPLLYGEGEGAFIRLQEEILKVSTDQSIFAWSFVDQVNWKSFKPHPSWVSVLAPFPVCFIDSRSVRTPEAQRHSAMQILSMTNLGLAMHLPLLATPSNRRFFAVLEAIEEEAICLCVPIIKVKGELIRVAWPPAPLPLCHLSKQPEPVPVYLPRHHRHGKRGDVWEEPAFIHPPRFLAFITTSCADFALERWTTTPGAELNIDYGFLSVVEPDNVEGVFLAFERSGNKKKGFRAVFLSKRRRSIAERRSTTEYLIFCQPWRVHELKPQWEEIWYDSGRQEASINLSDMLVEMATGRIALDTNTNPSYEIEAVMNLRYGEKLFPGVDYCSVLIRAMDHFKDFNMI